MNRNLQIIYRSRILYSFVRCALLVLCASLSLNSLIYAQEERSQTLPEGEGKQLTTFVCSQCHGLRETLLLRDGEKGWEEVVNRMVLYGTQLSPSEADLVTRYLATQLGPESGLMQSGTEAGVNSRTGSRFPLPAGQGKDLVAARCGVMCHDLGRVVSFNRSKSDWDTITRNMVHRGMRSNPNETSLMIAYLQANFSTNTSTTAPAHLVNTSFVARAKPEIRVQAGSTVAGQQLFLQKCFQCHSVQIKEARLGPSLFGEMREPHPKRTPAQVLTIIKNGKGKMPAYKDKLSKEDTDNLLAYIRSL